MLSLFLYITHCTCFLSRYFFEACAVWNEILIDYPLDMLSVKFCFDIYIYLGVMQEVRDILARVISHWTPDIPLYR